MIRLTFLGTGAAVPSVERNVTALLHLKDQLEKPS